MVGSFVLDLSLLSLMLGPTLALMQANLSRLVLNRSLILHAGINSVTQRPPTPIFELDLAAIFSIQIRELYT